MTSWKTSWQLLGAVSPRELRQAYVELHWAVQLVAAVGNTYREKRDDYSHQNVLWDSEQSLLVSRATERAPFVRGALRPADLKLLWLDHEGESQSELSLTGRTWEEALAWLGSQLPQTATLGKAPEVPGFELPEHPAQSGAFGEAGAAHAELARWFADANLVLQRWARGQPDASEVAGWPHHFDTATLMVIEPNEDHEKMKSVGAGFTPPDGVCTEPYFYVTPWPYPADGHAPGQLSAGRWHTQGFYGAVLPAGDVTGAGESAAEQASCVWMFLEQAVQQARELAQATKGSKP